MLLTCLLYHNFCRRKMLGMSIQESAPPLEELNPELVKNAPFGTVFAVQNGGIDLLGVHRGFGECWGFEVDHEKASIRPVIDNFLNPDSPSTRVTGIEGSIENFQPADVRSWDVLLAQMVVAKYQHYLESEALPPNGLLPRDIQRRIEIYQQTYPEILSDSVMRP